MTTPVVPGPGHDRYWPPAPSAPVVQPPPPRRRPMLGWILGGVALLVLAVAAAVVTTLVVVQRLGDGAGIAAIVQTGPTLTDVQTQCDADKAGTQVADGGKTLIIDGAGKADGGVGVTTDSLDCIFGVLEVPASVKEHVLQTRALDGRQQDSWPGYTASWAYHPDSGIEMIVQVS